MDTLARLSADRLVARMDELLSDERSVVVEFLRHLGEMDRRGLCLELGYSSLFAYCTDKLRLTKSAAYRRIVAARLMGKWPILAEYLADGRLCLTTLVELRDLLDEGKVEVLERAAGKTEDEVKELVAAMRPRPVFADVVRAVKPVGPLVAPTVPVGVVSVTPAGMPESAAPAPVAAAACSGPDPRAVMRPVAEEQWRMAFTVGKEFKERLDRVKSALSHKVPDGNLEEVFDECMKVALAELEKRRRGAEKGRSRESSAGGRHIPVAVRREVWNRDEGRCAFVGTDGKRCGSTHQVQFHHVVPFAKGGEATVDNVALHCRRHNIHRAEVDYGAEHMARFTGGGGSGGSLHPP